METIRTFEDLERAVEALGFLPFGGAEKDLLFTLEGRTNNVWHTGRADDPWLWRARLAEKGEQAYGKFFLGRGGFVARDCLPAFAALRRENRSAEALYEEGLLSRGAKRVYDCFMQRPRWDAPHLKAAAGFSRDKRGFEAALGELQGLFLLCVCGQSRKIDRSGAPYGWPGNDYALLEERFSAALQTRMMRQTGEAFLLARLKRAGDFPARAALRLLRGGSV